MTDDGALAADLVREAGLLARSMRADGVRATEKTSVSDLVTAADRAAEAHVVRRLQQERPDDGVVGEEGASRESTTGRTWVLDPVDGTWNFFHGLPWWCSALALQGPGEALLGAVFGPVEETTWLGGPGRPTTRNGVPVPMIEDRPLREVAAATYLHPPFFAQPHVDEPFERLVAEVATIRMLGSGSMDLAAVADGRIGLWCQHSVPVWDWLPGKALVEGAGGATRQVEVDGITWSVAGSRAGVAEAVAALLGDRAEG